MSSYEAGFITQQVDFYKRNIGKLGLSDEIKSKIDSELNALAQQLDKIFETNKNQLQNVTTELQNLRVSSNKQMRDLSRAKTSLEDSEKKFSFKEMTLNNQITQNKATILQLTNEIADLKKKNVIINKELERVKTTTNNKESTISDIKVEKQEISDEIDKLQKRIILLEKNLQNSEENFKKQEIVLKSKENEILVLQTENSEQKRKIDQTINKIQDLEQKSSLRALSSQNLEEKDTAIQNQFIGIQDENLKLIKNIENLTMTNSLLQNKLNDLERTREENFKEISILRDLKEKFESVSRQLVYKNGELNEVNQLNQVLQSNLLKTQELEKNLQTELLLKSERIVELEKIIEERTKQFDQIQDQLAKVSSLYTDLATTEVNFQENSLTLFNIYVMLVERLYDGKIHGRILFLLHSSKESWTRKEIVQATGGFMPAAILKAIHDLANAGIIYWDENTEILRLVQRFLD